MIDETADVKLIRFTFGSGGDGRVPFDFKAGQWVALRAPGQDGKPVTRAYSIASPPQEKRFLELCVKEVPSGKLTPFLLRMRPSDSVKIRSPQGRFVLHEQVAGGMIFVATGTGIAPFWSMISDLVARETDRELWLFFGARYEEDVLYEQAFAGLEGRCASFHRVVTLSRPRTADWAGERGYVQLQLKRHITDPGEMHVYICGLRNMVDAVVQTAREMGFREDRIFFERYD